MAEEQSDCWKLSVRRAHSLRVAARGLPCRRPALTPRSRGSKKDRTRTNPTRRSDHGGLAEAARDATRGDAETRGAVQGAERLGEGTAGQPSAGVAQDALCRDRVR